MGSFFAYFSSLELRTAPRTLWKRQLQPASWTCPECRSRRGPQRKYQHTDAREHDDFGAKGNLGVPVAFRGRSRGDVIPAFAKENALHPRKLRITRFASGTPIPERSDVLPSQLNNEKLEEWKRKFREALSRRDPYCLMAALEAGDRNPDFFHDLPPTTITEVLKLLDPDYFVTEYQDAYRNLSDFTVFKMGRVPVEYLLVGYTDSLRKVVRNLRMVGKKLRLADYRALLRCARACCFADAAEELWTDMKRNMIIPDTACYNHYLGAKCWDGAHVSMTRYSFRVTPFTLSARRLRKLGPQFANFRMQKGRRRGIKSHIMEHFEDMQRCGTPANEETFRHIMTALSREGDMGGVKAVLKRIFDLDVDAIMSDSDQPNLSTARRVSLTSPFYPTEQLLFTIAHIFGSNNDIPTALRLVDHLSQLYHLPITPATWRELLSWTFILAYPRSRSRSIRWSTDIGGLPETSVAQLFTTMINAPYHVAPTMETIKMLLSTARRAGAWDLMRVYLGRAEQLLHASVADAERAYHAYRLAQHDAVVLLGVDEAEAAARDERVQRTRALFETKDLIRARNRRTLRGFVHMLLGKPTLAHIPVDDGFQWQRRDVPDILWEHRPWVPSLVRYRTLGGVVELEFRTREEVEGLGRRAVLAAEGFALGEAMTTVTGRLVGARRGGGVGADVKEEREQGGLLSGGGSEQGSGSRRRWLREPD